MRSFTPLLGLLLALPLGIGCSVIADFGRYTADGGGSDECEPACGAAGTCVEGLCRCGEGPACLDSEACCGGGCVALGTVENCDACGDVCEAGDNATPTCGGTCGLSCALDFADCNDDPSDGCEANLGTPQTCGDCTTSCAVGEFCAAGACVATCPPTEAECSGSCFIVGEACSCVAGGGSGGRMCDPTGVVVCDYPGETCNGLDDDCDSVADNGFDCVMGESESCSVDMGSCIASGTAACGPTCTLDACVVVEVCNRADDTCDGFVDEGVLIDGTTVRTTFNASEPRGVWNPVDNEVGVVFTDAGGTLYFTTLAPDGTSRSGLLLLATTADWWPDITWDGTAYLVAYSRTLTVTVLRIDASSGTVTSSYSTPSSYVNSVRIAMVGEATNQAVLVWTDDRGSTYETLDLPSSIAGAPTTRERRPLNTAAGVISPFAVTTRDGATIGYSRTGSTELWVHALRVDGGSSARSFPRPDYPASIVAAYDPISRNVGLVFVNMRVSGGAATPVGATLMILNSGLAAIAISDLLTNASPFVAIAVGADETFGVYAQASSRASEIWRYRARDGARYTETLPSTRTSGTPNLVGIDTGPVRYLALTTAASPRILSAQPVQCR